MLGAILTATLATGCPGETPVPPALADVLTAAGDAKIQTVRHDPSLDVRITSVRDLRYEAGADASLDRPAIVRAGSGAAVSGGTLYIAQDDANFIGAIDLATGTVGAITLPAGDGGKRLFDDGRGNKPSKMDLESIVVLPDGSVLAIGSGSMVKRMKAVHIRDGVPHVIDARPLFESLAARQDFAGAELNLEGATVFRRDGRTWVRLFQRGNGDASKGPVFDASAEVPLDDVLAGRATEPENVRRYDLGRTEGVRLTFSDATPAPAGGTAFLASAEDSPSATEDGPLAGVVIGSIDADGTARYGRIVEADGTPSTRKLEGLAWDAANLRWLAIEDVDDPTVASQLVTLSPK